MRTAMFLPTAHQAAIEFARNHPTLPHIEAFQLYVDSLPPVQRESLVRYIARVPVLQPSLDLDVFVPLRPWQTP
jgi:hypothetical protein